MEDYKGITGDYADTNRDGKVDFVEYDSDCYDFEHIYKKGHSSGGYTPQKQSGFKGWLRNMTVTHWIIIILFVLCFAIWKNRIYRKNIYVYFLRDLSFCIFFMSGNINLCNKQYNKKFFKTLSYY